MVVAIIFSAISIIINIYVLTKLWWMEKAMCDLCEKWRKDE